MTGGTFLERHPWLARFATDRGLASLIDHTLLRPEATEGEIRRLCDQALEFGFAAVCVHGQWVGLATERLRGSGVRVAAVVGFPHGAGGLVAKAAETRLVVGDGAEEVDMVASLGWLLSGAWQEFRDEVAAVVDAARGRPVKVILETAALEPRQRERAARLAVDAGAAMLKTSTGFHPAGGARVEAVQALRLVAGEAIGVKASGGIRTPADAVALLRAGADRLGTSAAAGWGEVLGPAAPLLADLVG